VWKPAGTFTGTVGQTFPALTAGSYAVTSTKLSKGCDRRERRHLLPAHVSRRSTHTLLDTQATFSAPASGVRGTEISVSGTGWIPGKEGNDQPDRERPSSRRP